MIRGSLKNSEKPLWPLFSLSVSFTVLPCERLNDIVDKQLQLVFRPSKITSFMSNPHIEEGGSKAQVNRTEWGVASSMRMPLISDQSSEVKRNSAVHRLEIINWFYYRKLNNALYNFSSSSSSAHHHHHHIIIIIIIIIINFIIPTPRHYAYHSSNLIGWRKCFTLR